MNSVEEIAKRYGAGLRRVAASYEADPVLREDLVQETFLSIHRALPGLRDPASLGPFVFRIAHNRGVTHVTRQASYRRAIEAPPPEPQIDAEEDLLQRERSASLLHAVRRLSLPYKQVITLVLEEFSHAEIAATLGISVSNVAVRVTRAKAQLKELLDER